MTKSPCGRECLIYLLYHTGQKIPVTLTPGDLIQPVMQIIEHHISFGLPAIWQRQEQFPWVLPQMSEMDITLITFI